MEDSETKAFIKQAAESSLRKVEEAVKRGSIEVAETHVVRAMEVLDQFHADDPFWTPTDFEKLREELKKPVSLTSELDTEKAYALKRAAKESGVEDRVKLSLPGTKYDFIGKKRTVQEGKILVEIDDIPRNIMPRIWKRQKELLKEKRKP